MKEDKTKEIDLLDLLQSIGKSIANFFKFLYESLWWLIVFGIKNYIAIIVFAIIGLGWGIYSVSSSKDVYQSFMKIRSNAMPSNELKPYIQEINKYLGSKGEITYPILEKKLNIDSAKVSEIVAVKSHYYIDYWNDGSLDEIDKDDTHPVKDTINVIDSTYLSIEARVNDPLLFENLGKNLVDYLNSNPKIIPVNNNRYSFVKYEANALKNEIQLLDSLQRFSYFNGSRDLQQLQFNNRQGLILGENRQQLYHWEKIRLERRRKPLVTELELYAEPVTIIDDFPIVTTKMSSGLFELIKSVIIITAIGYLILLLIYFFKKNYSKYSDRV